MRRTRLLHIQYVECRALWGERERMRRQTQRLGEAQAHPSVSRLYVARVARAPTRMPVRSCVKYMTVICVQVEKPGNEATTKKLSYDFYVAFPSFLALNQNLHTAFQMRIPRDRHFCAHSFLDALPASH